LLPLFIIGSIGGFLSGVLGIGGGVVFVPLLTYFTDQDFKINTGISSMAVVFVATTSSITYISNGQSFSIYILYLIFGGILGGYLGSKLTFQLDTKTLQRIFAVLLLVVSYRMISTSGYSSQYEENIFLYLLIGVFSGILSGLLGIGGGIGRNSKDSFVNLFWWFRKFTSTRLFINSNCSHCTYGSIYKTEK